MVSSDNNNTIITYAVLAGLTPLIPIPFIDDVALRYFKRHLVRQLSSSHGTSLSDEQIRALIDDASSGGYVSGVAGAVIKYPLKKVFRKVFYFLEWKRAADTASRTYYQGFLIDHALAKGWCEPIGTRSVLQVRSSIDRVLASTDTRPIEFAVASTFRGFKGLIGDAAALIGRQISATIGKGGDKKAELAVAEAEQRGEQQLGGVIDQLRTAIAAMPTQHFTTLREGLAKELA